MEKESRNVFFEEIPGSGRVEITSFVFDYNGTLATDGIPLPGVEEQLIKLAEKGDIYILTADTFGTAATYVEEWPAELVILPQDDQKEAKAEFVKKLGSGRCAALGNGANDGAMIAAARLGICLIQDEGCSASTLGKADLVFTRISDAIDVFLKPGRLRATLRV